MDEALLKEMTKVYMTDAGAERAVRAFIAEHGGTETEAALQVAQRVAPAPHNAAAHDARYLLAPDAEQADLDNWNREIDPLRQDQEAFEAQARRHVEGEHDLDDVVGPIPPHPQDDLDDRQRFTEIRTLTAEQYAELHTISPMIEHEEADSCGVMCKIVRALVGQVAEAQRLPAGPPLMSLEQIGETWTLRLSVDTVPLRRRNALMLAHFGDEDGLIEKLVAELAEMMEDVPDHRLMVRRNPAEAWVTAVVYKPTHSCGHNHSGAGYTILTASSPDQVQALLAMLFGGDTEPGGLEEVASGAGIENGQEA